MVLKLEVSVCDALLDDIPQRLVYVCPSIHSAVFQFWRQTQIQLELPDKDARSKRADDSVLPWCVILGFFLHRKRDYIQMYPHLPSSSFHFHLFLAVQTSLRPKSTFVLLKR
jgi:hypothetical protein